METVKYSPIGAEDLKLGTSSFEVELSDGRRATKSEINLSTFTGASTVIDTAVFFTDGSDVGQDSDFVYNKTTNQLTVASIIRVGSTGTSGTYGEQLHVNNAGAAKITIENTSSSDGDVGVSWAKEGTQNWSILFDDSNGDDLSIQNDGTVSSIPHLLFSSSSAKMSVGTDTHNANMTIGLNIDQGAADNEIISLKSSDVAHGTTGVTETDVYLMMKKETAGSGGGLIEGFTESVVGLELTGTQTTANTQKNSLGVGAVHIVGYEISGTSRGTMTANANVFTVAENTDTVFIVDVEGDLHVDGSGSLATFDSYDDVALLTSVKSIMSPTFKHSLGAFIDESRDILERGGVITGNSSGGYFISHKGMWGLLIDAIRQLNAKIESR